MGSGVAAPRLQSTGSVVAVHVLNCSVACGILLYQGSSPCLLHWQAGSLPVSHQGSPEVSLEIILYLVLVGAWEAGREGHNEFNPYRKKEICPPSSLANPPPRDNLTNLLVCVCPSRLSPYSLNVGIVKVAQSCPTLCDPMDYSPWNFPGQNTGVGSLSLLQGIFPTQGSNSGLLLCRRILYQLSICRSCCFSFAKAWLKF